MNKEFKIEDEKVTVINEGGLKLIRNLNPNIKEILICENNIEEIENMIEKDNDRIKNNKLDTHDYILFPSLGAAQLANAALQLAFNNIALAISFAGLGIAYLSIHFIYSIKPHRRKLKIYRKRLTILENEKEKEITELNELKSKETNAPNNTNFESYKLETSEKIKNLKRKLEIIYYFELYKKRFIKAYKTQTLQDKFPFFFFKEEELAFLEELIKDALKEKQKIKKLKI